MSRAAYKDWLGLEDVCYLSPQAQKELTRAQECRRLIWGPMPGEDYFETISMLKAVTAAKGSFTVLEAGSWTGYWGLKAVKAFRQLDSHAPCHVVLIEWEAPMSAASEHLERNGIFELCNVTLHQSRATGALLDSTIKTLGHLDLLHVDIQKDELYLISESQLLQHVRYLHVATHARIIHRHLQTWLQLRDFQISFDYEPQSFVRTPYGPVAFDDGLLAAEKEPKRAFEKSFKWTYELANYEYRSIQLMSFRSLY